MKATIKKGFHAEQELKQVWEFLSDTEKIASCVPGATITEKVDDKNYKGEVVMKFGPVKAKYNGDISIEELDHELKKMVLKGVGKDSKGKGSAEMLMNAEACEAVDGGTEVVCEMEISVNGMLAQFGSRLITDVSDQITDQFINNFKSKLGGEEIEDNTISAGAIAGKVLKDKIGGLFGGSKNT